MRKTILCLLLALSALVATAQNNSYVLYIERYKGMAVEQMQIYKIPASITLAQGLLESNAGNSTLAKKANNHFGIKCGGSWTGPYMLRDDDAPNEKFRVYKSAAESYEDHSLFLRYNRRYAGLFNLDMRDYKSWAYGLKAAGYATNPNYPKLLISIIEAYDLTQYDRMLRGDKSQKLSSKIHSSGLAYNQHELRLCNDIVYVIAKQGDTFKSISKEVGISERKLRKYNEVSKKYQLQPGDIIYLTKKKSRVCKPLRGSTHTVQPGESVYFISQLYGIRLEKLYKWNKLPNDYVAKVGQQLKLK